MVAELEADRGGSRRNSTASGGSYEAQWEAAHAARERTSRRERDLEAQLAAVRAQLARGGGSRVQSTRQRRAVASSVQDRAVRLSAEGIREPVRVSTDDYVAPTVTIDRRIDHSRPPAPDVGVTDLNAPKNSW